MVEIEKVPKEGNIIHERIQEIDEEINSIATRFSEISKLKGHLRPEFVRCEKQGCRCRDGIKHGPYWYLYRYEKGKLRKKYIGRDLPEDLRKIAEKRKMKKELLKRIDELREERKRLVLEYLLVHGGI